MAFANRRSVRLARKTRNVIRPGKDRTSQDNGPSRAPWLCRSDRAQFSTSPLLTEKEPVLDPRCISLSSDANGGNLLDVNLDLDGSPLQLMPGELRNSVYKFALHEEEGIPLSVTDCWRPAGGKGEVQSLNFRYTGKGPHGLRSTCKAIRLETNGLYLASNTELNFDPRQFIALEPSQQDMANLVCCWASHIGYENANGIRHVRVRMDHPTLGQTNRQTTRWARQLQMIFPLCFHRNCTMTLVLGTELRAGDGAITLSVKMDDVDKTYEKVKALGDVAHREILMEPIEGAVHRAEKEDGRSAVEDGGQSHKLREKKESLLAFLRFLGWRTRNKTKTTVPDVFAALVAQLRTSYRSRPPGMGWGSQSLGGV